MKKSLRILGQESTIEEGDGISRRSFLKGASVASAGLVAGCADKAEQVIYPNVKGDSSQIPGVPTFYNSTCTGCDAGCGITVKTYEGRVTTIEGNSKHPVNKGGVCALGHSTLQDHYDPDRVRQPLKKSADGTFKPISWIEALKEVTKILDNNGKKAFLSGTINGTLNKLVKRWSKERAVEHYVYNPLDQVALAEAHRVVYGTKGIPEYKLDKAELIVSFSADYLETWISPAGLAKGWSKARKGSHPVRTVQIEPRLSLTGANADHKIIHSPGMDVTIAKFLLQEIAKFKKDSQFSDLGLTAVEVAKSSGVKAETLKKTVKLLIEAAKKGKGVVLAGGTAVDHEKTEELYQTVLAINYIIGAHETVIDYSKIRKPQTDFAAVAELIGDINESKYSVLFIDGSNPRFKLPASTNIKLALNKLDYLVSFASHLDETTKQANLILPSSSSLESWGDSQPYSGIHSLIQPAMLPVFDTKPLGDILISLAKSDKLKAYKDFYTYLRTEWKKIVKDEKSWLKAVEQGGVFKRTRKPTLSMVNFVKIASGATIAKFDNHKIKEKTDLVLLPYPSVKTFDGRAANRPWMQEIPDPMTSIAWDTWAEISPNTAKDMGLKTGEVVRVNNYYGELNIPVYITDYIADNVVAVPIGNGHEDYGRYASSVEGGNVYDLLPNNLSGGGLGAFTTKVAIKKSPTQRALVRTQGEVEDSDKQGDRHLLQTEEISEHHEDHHGGHHGPSEAQMYEQRVHPLYNWGMAIDLDACTGCSACVAACYSENNIPTVGKEIMNQGREMSWIRLERYDDGTAEEIEVNFMPAMCQHCNNAPCEPVCPVYATYHNEDGLNVMVYNRCVGTRYCGNNCVYKQRRFNWFEYDFPEPLNLQLNPEVQKRSAGVMEKCSFCVHKIKDAKDRAKDQGRLVVDGEVQPACVKSCPTEALVFGDLNDPNSKVSKMAHDQRAYKVLDHHLNTQPSVSYLKNRKYKA